ncbi:hypothetical protein CAPTEDRAFT_171286 [Capitella teleta]|uniref:Death domain-containing protein n=1 Tax=Capitella teleta TaxID=283909 RepID=R7VH10_CAPTE|nr:hypothetical protein CAPTEDRAFT_171286 [Capitella teleta]|eukprot:ELU17899.1 hypothetical protein CAPTEDRAFT_171286 [Capitella teleta]
MSNLEFKVMLANLAREMSARDLETMKFMCSDFIPKAVKEEIDSGLQLWTALEERDKLSQGDTAFLRILLQNCVSKRTDLIGILNKYEAQLPSTGVAPSVMVTPHPHHPPNIKEAPPYVPSDVQQAFNIITTDIGRNWRPLVRNLGLSEASIDECVERHPRSLREQVMMALNLWASTPGVNASTEELRKALNKTQLKLIAQKLK